MSPDTNLLLLALLAVGLVAFAAGVFIGWLVEMTWRDEREFSRGYAAGKRSAETGLVLGGEACKRRVRL